MPRAVLWQMWNCNWTHQLLIMNCMRQRKFFSSVLLLFQMLFIVLNFHKKYRYFLPLRTGSEHCDQVQRYALYMTIFHPLISLLIRIKQHVFGTVHLSLVFCINVFVLIGWSLCTETCVFMMKTLNSLCVDHSDWVGLVFLVPWIPRIHVIPFKPV